MTVQNPFETLIWPLLMQLAVQAPVLLTYLVGAILALMLSRRAPGPSLLTLAATVLLLLTAVAQGSAQVWLTHAHNDLRLEPRHVGLWFSIIAFVGSGIRAVAVSLLLTAVFIGRRNSAEVSA